MTQTNNEREAFELAVVNNLGKEALLKENLSPLEIFERGWNARAQSPISKNERQQVVGFIDEADDGIFGDVQKGIAEGLCKVGDLLYTSPPKQIHDGWKLISDELPITGIRVLIYTDGVDFNGEQYFDVQSDSLNECFYENRDDMPEVCIHATHWMPLPEAPTTSLSSETNTEVGNEHSRLG